MMAGIFTGRLVRWREIAKDEDLILKSAWEKSCEYALLGYSWEKIGKAWRRTRHDPTRT